MPRLGNRHEKGRRETHLLHRRNQRLHIINGFEWHRKGQNQLRGKTVQLHLHSQREVPQGNFVSGFDRRDGGGGIRVSVGFAGRQVP